MEYARMVQNFNKKYKRLPIYLFFSMKFGGLRDVQINSIAFYKVVFTLDDDNNSDTSEYDLEIKVEFLALMSQNKAFLHDLV